MKKKPKPAVVYAEPADNAMSVAEAAKAVGLTRDVVSVREAKDSLSSLLQRAADGEEIVITSDGQPKAMIVRYRPVIIGAPARSRAALRASMPMGPDSTAMIRAERDGRY
jgi:prevent-host-death family protein